MSNSQNKWQLLQQNWKEDLLSGTLVFLIALPLCFGISLASGFPPMAGIIAATIGGLVVSMIGGAHTTINGPAAGLIVVILSGVESLGKGDPIAGYKYTLAAIVVAGIMQMTLGLFRAGKLNAYFPDTVIHGMLASIGIIIMSKQIHTMMGVQVKGSILSVIAQIPNSIIHCNPHIAFIGVTSLVILALHPHLDIKWLKRIPAPIFVVLVGVIFEKIFGLDMKHNYMVNGTKYDVGPEYLLTLPEKIIDGFTFPDWGKAFTPEFWRVAVTIALVAGIETLVSAMAVDKLDRYKRKTRANKDLFAMGFGTTLSGAIGGLPMIAEIVRSSANVANGARSVWSNFFHGALIISSVCLIPQILHMIPLSSLAALLVFTGFRLASPKAFRHTWKIGSDQFTIFCATILGTLATDLLMGIFIGIGCKMIFHLIRGVTLKEMFKVKVEREVGHDGHLHFKIIGPLVFTNLLSLKNELKKIPLEQKVFIKINGCSLIDHTSMEYLFHYKHEHKERGGDLLLEGISEFKGVGHHPLAAKLNIFPMKNRLKKEKEKDKKVA